jgi:hypothetical protein
MQYAGIHRTIVRNVNRSGRPRIRWTGADGRKVMVRSHLEAITLRPIVRIAGSGEQTAGQVIAVLAPHLIEAACGVPIDVEDSREVACADAVFGAIERGEPLRSIRLIIADWFDEQGDPRGEAIRRAVEKPLLDQFGQIIRSEPS